MINIIDRYISKLFLGYFVASLAIFVSLFVVVNFMSEMVRYNAATSALLRYYLFYLPAVVYLLLPVAALVATVFTLSTLNRTRELVALYSTGMSLFRISSPILGWVALMTVASFVTSDRLLPMLAQKRNYIMYVEIRDQPGLYSTVKTNRIWYRSKNILFNIKTLQADKNHAQGITLYYFNDDWDLIQMITASSVDIAGSIWRLKDGTVTLYSKEQSSPLTQVFKDKAITMDEEVKDLQKTSNSDDVMSMADLRDYIRKNKEAGLDTVHYEVAYHSKFGFAMAVFVMSFLGIPFSVSRQRSGGNFANIGLCMLLAFIYWALYSSMQTLGEYGRVSPALSAWIPNITMLLLSLIFLVRLKR